MAKDPPEVWRANIDGKGRVYYYNTLSKKTAWNLPKRAQLEPPTQQDVRTKKAVLLVSAALSIARESSRLKSKKSMPPQKKTACTGMRLSVCVFASCMAQCHKSSSVTTAVDTGAYPVAGSRGKEAKACGADWHRGSFSGWCEICACARP